VRQILIVTPAQMPGCLCLETRHTLGVPKLDRARSLSVDQGELTQPDSDHPPEDFIMKRISLIAAAAVLLAGAQLHTQSTTTKTDTAKKTAAKTASTAAKSAKADAKAADKSATAAKSEAKVATAASAKAADATAPKKTKKSKKAKKDTTAVKKP
jgi:hypothetical protein